jgi:hypothetical protein
MTRQPRFCIPSAQWRPMPVEQPVIKMMGICIGEKAQTTGGPDNGAEWRRDLDSASLAGRKASQLNSSAGEALLDEMTNDHDHADQSYRDRDDGR